MVNSISIDRAINNEREKTPNSTKIIEEQPTSQPLGYYLKHNVNKETITNWIRGNRHSQSSKMTSNEEEGEDDCDTLPRGPLYEKLLKQKVATKQMAYGNFEIPASIGKLQYLDPSLIKGQK